MTPHLPTLFVSDLHLHPSRPETADRFGAFLAGPARQAQALYILGDLFDAWAGDDDLGDAFNAGVCADLKTLATAGTRIYFLPGNRDFLIGDACAAACGMTPLADATVVDIGGVATLLLHGDTLCTEDREYQDFRAVVRSPDWRRDFLAKPLAVRKAEIAALRARSESGKRVKPAALMDVSAAAVAQAFATHRVTRIIHGHIHRQAHHLHDGGERWALPEWDHRGGALACDEAGCRWLTVT
ncbi:MAG: UDP-2,3-diacylglucosamine diphosphatase [Rhodocyclales bacterium]|nr:UDP-2,3-diacylglucosamine diphosphatase [Rhodocyclales bacterium]